MARGSRDDEGVGGRGEGEETKGKKSWYYKSVVGVEERGIKKGKKMLVVVEVVTAGRGS
jgi:hypothetical protein